MNELTIKATLNKEIENISLNDQLRLNKIRNNVLKSETKNKRLFFLKPAYSLFLAVPLIFFLNIGNNEPTEQIVKIDQFEKNIYEWNSDNFIYAIALDTYTIEVEDFYL